MVTIVTYDIRMFILNQKKQCVCFFYLQKNVHCTTRMHFRSTMCVLNCLSLINDFSDTQAKCTLTSYFSLNCMVYTDWYQLVHNVYYTLYSTVYDVYYTSYQKSFKNRSTQCTHINILNILIKYISVSCNLIYLNNRNFILLNHLYRIQSVDSTLWMLFNKKTKFKMHLYYRYITVIVCNDEYNKTLVLNVYLISLLHAMYSMNTIHSFFISIRYLVSTQSRY